MMTMSTFDESKIEYMTPEELVERYRGKINTRTLDNWRSTGEGPAYTKIGGKVLYPVRAVKEWEQRRTREM